MVKLLLFFLWAGLLPFLIGSDWSGRHKTYPGSIFLAYFYGIFIEFALFEILAVPMIFLDASLRQLSFSWLILSAAFAVCSVVRSHGFRSLRGKIRGNSRRWAELLRRKVTPLFVILLVCILLELLFVTLGQHIDDDDAFYLATANTAVQTNSLMRYNPFTGELYESLPSRYVFAAWPLYLANLANLTGFHPTLIAHMLIPGFALCMVYMVYALIARDLFPGKDETQKKNLFLILILVILTFFGFSIYTNGTFLLVRAWQGKALVAALTQPALFYLCRSAMKMQGGWTGWAGLFCVVTASCMFSSMGVVLTIIPVGVYTLCYAVSQKRWRYLPYALASCAGAVLNGAAYLLIK